MKKRLLTFMLALSLLTLPACAAERAGGPPAAPETPSAVTAAPLRTFADVPAGAWYADAAAYCSEHGLMGGTAPDRFSPDETMTRAMLAAVIHRMAGSPAVSAAPAFSDTVDGAWYGGAVAWAAAGGVMSGYGGGAFGVNDPVTREQMAAILWRYAGSPPAEASVFADRADISPWAVSAVDWAGAGGIMGGKANGRFDPKADVTRAEVAAILYRFGDPDQEEPPDTTDDARILVAYFSATGTTRSMAGRAADALAADLYEIVPETPYTSDDLDYGNASSRTTRERDDPAARPAIDGSVEDMGGYDVVFLGYPIWHGQAPKIVSTFLERYDFTGKTIVPFCTSHSSGIGSSDTDLHPLAPGAHWLEGRRFAAGTSQDDVSEWIGGLDLPKREEAAAGRAAFDFDTRTVTLNSGHVMPINGLGTYSLHGDECRNAVAAALDSGVRLFDTAHAYGNETELGEAIRASGVPREEIFVITKLYPDQYANAGAAIDEALEKLGLGYVDLMLLHHPGAGDVDAYRAMERAVEAGKIRSLGLSNWYVEELEEFLPQVTITPALVQNEIHPYYQENDVIPYIQGLGIVVQGWYPLGGRGHTAQLLGDPVISAIAEAHGKSSAQVILRWNLQKGVVVIPGSSNPGHIRENTELYDFELTQRDMARINALDRGEKHDWY